MNKILKLIILFGILLFANSGQLFDRALSTDIIQVETVSYQTTIFNLFESYTLLYSAKQPVKEDFYDCLFQ